MGSRPKGAMRVKAIMKLVNPILAQPVEPICVMKKVQIDGVDTNEDSTVPVLSDKMYEFDMDKFMIRYELWVVKDESWEPVNNMIYNLVLSHVPTVL